MNIALILPILIIIAIYYFSLRNGLVQRFNKVEQAYQNLQARLQSRDSAIPSLINLIETHFDKTDKTLTELKATLNLVSESKKDRLANSRKQEALLSMLKQKINQFPQSNDNFTLALATLNEHEEQLSASRRSYTAAVKDYNTAVESFPSNIIADSMNLGASDYMHEEDETLELKDIEEQRSLEILDRHDNEFNA